MPTYFDQKKSSSEKHRWNRDEIASTIIDFESAKNEISQRQYAKQKGIPRTTLQYWSSRKESIEAPSELIDFFEKPFGIAFLHRMIMAAHYEFCKKGPASIHNVSNFLKLCQLEPFVATSYSSQRTIANAMDRTIIHFGESEQEILVKTMDTKWITLCEDETFHPAICMVAIDAESNFILLEEYVEKRDGETWNRVAGKALKDLPVKVIQVTSDEAKGLIKHTKKGLGAHHSPDVFHVQQEIGKGTSGALNSIIRKREKEIEQAAKEVAMKKHAKAQYENLPKRPRGRRPNFEKKIATASEHEKQAATVLNNAKENLETVLQAKRDIGACYHPYDPETGEKQDSKKVAELLESHFHSIHSATVELSDRCKKRVEKAQRVVKEMVGSIAFFFMMIHQYADNMGLSEDERKFMSDYLIPGYYLQKVARKEKDVVRKKAISKISQRLLSILSDPKGLLSNCSHEQIEKLKKSAQDCSAIFQRSSSCVEGRNAQLSLKHHGIHRLSSQHLKALTVVHNFDIKNKDGSTAAERFFGAEHNNLFEWLLMNMDFPARPRKRMPIAA